MTDRVREVVAAIPEDDLCGAWYDAARGKVRISLGDWSETPGAPVRTALEAILGVGEDKVEVDAELGTPIAGDWEKLADRDDDPEFVAESDRIKENQKKPENQRPHKFQPAEWTHPNGHPRCLRCGDEEPVGGMCAGHDPGRNRPRRDKADATRGRRIQKHDNRVARAHNPVIRAFGKRIGIDVTDILLPTKKADVDPLVAWRSQPAQDELSGYHGRSRATNAETMGTLAARLAMDKAIVHENPWFRQDLEFRPDVAYGDYSIQPQTVRNAPIGKPIFSGF